MTKNATEEDTIDHVKYCIAQRVGGYLDLDLSGWERPGVGHATRVSLAMLGKRDRGVPQPGGF